MSLPVGVTTANVTVSSPISSEGTQAAIDVSIKINQTVIHVASGVEIMPASDRLTASAGGSVSFTVPHVNQSGFVDTTGAAITGWSYNVAVVATWPNGDKQTFTANVAPLVGQATVDADLVARAAIPGAVVGLIQAVTSVGGLGPGPVDAAALAAVLVPFLPVATIPDASTTVKGLIALASNAVTAAGTDALKAVTPASLAFVLAGFQPHDADLDTFAATPSTSYGRALLNLANQAALSALLAGATVANPIFTGTVTVPTPIVGGAAANKSYADAAIAAALAAYTPPGVTRRTLTANVGPIASNSLNTAGPVTGLDVAAAAGTQVEVSVRLFIWADTTDDVKVDVQGPAGATFIGTITGPTATASSSSATRNQVPAIAGSVGVFGCLGFDTTQVTQLTVVDVEGVWTVGGTAGNLSVRVAKNSAAPTTNPLTIRAGSNVLGVVTG